MKRIIFEIVLVLIFIALFTFVAVIVDRHTQHGQVTEQIDTIMVSDARNEIAYDNAIARLDSLQQKESEKLEKYKQRAYVYANSSRYWKQFADSILKVTKIDTTCQKLVNSKDSVIEALDNELVELDSELQVYSNKLHLANQQIKQDTIFIHERSRTIQALSDRIEKIQCTNNWIQRHKISAWLFGIKCR